MASLFKHIDHHKFDNKMVCVVYGGDSLEREVSLRTGKALAGALRDYGHEVVEYDLPRDLEQLRKDRPSAAVLAMHGGFGENGILQGWLELEQIPYTGCRVAACAIAMDKFATKQLCRAADVKVARAAFLDSYGTENLDEAVAKLFEVAELYFPLILKRNDAGSSYGVAIAHNREEFDTLIHSEEMQIDPNDASDGILIEEYVEGPEYSVGFFDDICLGAIKITPAEEFYDLKAKYSSKSTTYESIEPGELFDSLEKIGRRAYRVLGCRGVVRIDIIGNDDNLNVLEANTLPGMTETSLIPKMARHLGISFPEFANFLLCSATLSHTFSNAKP